MKKVLFLTDIHLTDGDQPIIGISPKQRFVDAFTQALDHHGDALHLFSMGDLAHHGHKNAYANFKAILGNLQIPYTLMLGNHDRRAPFAQIFGDTGFRQGGIDIAGFDFIYLDTLDEDAPDRHSGFLCPDRLAWLRGTLHSGTAPAIVLMHHHLHPTGFDGMDSIALRNAAQVCDILQETPRVKHNINGHVHRDITCQIGPIPFQ